MASGRLWTSKEIEAAIALYLVTPFGKIHSGNHDIIELSKKLNRTPSAIALKLTNLASIDETLDRKGMSNYSKLDKDTWETFFSKLIDSAAAIIETDFPIPPNSFNETPQSSFKTENQHGNDKFIISTTRQGQARFREIIMANYDKKCAVTGISQCDLLVAAHILPWAEDKQNRMNPRNGILMNRLHDQAYEKGLITFSDDGKILYSDQLEKNTRFKLQDIEKDGYLTMLSKFIPDSSLIRMHREKFDCAWIN